MRRICGVLILAAIASGVLAGSAFAQITMDQSRSMSEIFTSPNQATNSDLAFWGKHAFVRLLHRRHRLPGRYSIPRRGADLRYLESGQSAPGEGFRL